MFQKYLENYFDNCLNKRAWFEAYYLFDIHFEYTDNVNNDV